MPKIIMTKSRLTSPIVRKRVNPASEMLKFTVPILLNIALLGISIFLFYNIGKSIYLAGQKLEILERAEQEVVTLRLTNIDLIMQKGEVSNPEFVEKEVRNRLNYAKENEVQLVIPNGLYKRYEESAVLGLSSNMPAEKRDTNAQMKVWFDFFINGL
jgi:cell division protein FtsB